MPSSDGAAHTSRRGGGVSLARPRGASGVGITALGTDQTFVDPVQRATTRKAPLLPQAIEAYAAHLRGNPQTRKAARYSAAVLQRVAREERSHIWTSQVYRERLERLRHRASPSRPSTKRRGSSRISYRFLSRTTVGRNAFTTPMARSQSRFRASATTGPRRGARARPRVPRFPS